MDAFPDHLTHMKKNYPNSIVSLNKLYRVIGGLYAHVAMTSVKLRDDSPHELVFEPIQLAGGDEIALDCDGLPYVSIRGRLHPIRIFSMAINLDRLTVLSRERKLSGEDVSRFKTAYIFSRAAIEGHVESISAYRPPISWPFTPLDHLATHVFHSLLASGSMYRSMLSQTEWQSNEPIARPASVDAFTPASTREVRSARQLRAYPLFAH